MINCGLHDIKADVVTAAIQVPLARYEQNLFAILEEIRAMNLRLVRINTTPVIDEIHNTRPKGFHRFARDVTAINTAAAKIEKHLGMPGDTSSGNDKSP